MDADQLHEHRELQYLRAAARCHPRRRVRSSAMRRRRKYEALRWHKLLSVRRQKGRHGSY